MLLIPPNLGEISRNMAEISRNMAEIPRNMAEIPRNMAEIPRNLGVCGPNLNVCGRNLATSVSFVVSVAGVGDEILVLTCRIHQKREASASEVVEESSRTAVFTRGMWNDGT